VAHQKKVGNIGKKKVPIYSVKNKIEKMDLGRKNIPNIPKKISQSINNFCPNFFALIFLKIDISR
jgi:hypothetical protein